MARGGPGLWGLSTASCPWLCAGRRLLVFAFENSLQPPRPLSLLPPGCEQRAGLVPVPGPTKAGGRGSRPIWRRRATRTHMAIDRALPGEEP